MALVKPVRRFAVYLVALEPTIRSEIRKMRPCIVVSPDELNRHLSTTIVVPLTSSVKGYPSRIALTFLGKNGEAVLEQIRTVDRKRLVRRLGVLSPGAARQIAERVVEIFRLD